MYHLKQVDPMTRHQYVSDSLKREQLKGTDRRLFNILSHLFGVKNVKTQTIGIETCTYWSDNEYSHIEAAPMSFDVNDKYHIDKLEKQSCHILPMSYDCGTVNVYSQIYIEWVGNEGQPEENSICLWCSIGIS